MSDQIPALDRLDQLVRQAGERLRDQRSENAELSERIVELERQLETRAADAAEAWKEEKEALLKRVEKLVEGLDQLLAVAED
jgi:DNA repair exonuclease SbcCD ATPase subunit